MANLKEKVKIIVKTTYEIRKELLNLGEVLG